MAFSTSSFRSWSCPFVNLPFHWVLLAPQFHVRSSQFQFSLLAWNRVHGRDCLSVLQSRTFSMAQSSSSFPAPALCIARVPCSPLSLWKATKKVNMTLSPHPQTEIGMVGWSPWNTKRYAMIIASWDVVFSVFTTHHEHCASVGPVRLSDLPFEWGAFNGSNCLVVGTFYGLNDVLTTIPSKDTSNLEQEQNCGSEQCHVSNFRRGLRWSKIGCAYLKDQTLGRSFVFIRRWLHPVWLMVGTTRRL